MIKKRFGFAIQGIIAAAKSEWSFRVHLLATILVIIFLLISKPEPIWCAVILFLIGAVLSAELFNTALESALDAIHPNPHPLIKKAKDCAAGAVLILSLGAVAVFGLLLWQLYMPKV